MTTKNINIVIRADDSGGQRVKRTLDEIANAEKKVNSETVSLGGAFSSLKGIMIAVGTSFAIREALRMADSFIQLSSRVKSSTRDMNEFKASFSALQKVSVTTGSDMKTLVDVFQRISFVRNEIKATASEMVQFTETVSKLGTISGATNDAMKNGLTQLGQSLSSGVVRAEEFNSIMENIPAIGVKIAEQFGVTTGELRRLVVAGKVASEDVFKAILNVSKETNAEFSKLPITAERGFSVLEAGMSQFVGSLEEALGFSNKIGKVFETIGNALARDSKLIQDYFNPSESKINNSKQRNGSNIVSEYLNEDSGVYDRSINDLLNKTSGAAKSKKSSADPTLAAKYQPLVGGLSTDKAADKQANSIKKVTDELKFENEQMKRSKELQETYNALRDAGVSINSKAGKQIHQLTIEHQALEKEQKNMMRVIDGVDKGFKDLFTGAISGARSFKDVMKGILSDVSGMFYDMMIKDNLRSMLGSFLGGSGGGGGDILGSLFNSAKGFFGFASGGSFNVGGTGGTDSQLVAFRASPNERVTVSTPSQSGSGSSGNAVTYNIDARGADAGAVERLQNAMMQLHGSIEKRAEAAVQRQMQRDPTYGRRG